MMKFAILSSFCVLSVCAAVLPQARNSGAYESRLENDVVAVYHVNLPPHASAPNFRSGHDTFWIALNDGVLGFIGSKDSKK